MSQDGFLLSRKITTFKDLASWIDAMKTRERQRNRLVIVQWLEAIAAYHGYHDLRVAQDLRLYQRLSKRQEKDLMDVGCNFVLPHVRTITAKAVRSRPIVQAAPFSSDESDIQAAKYSDQFLTAEWQQQEMDISKIEVAAWVGATGNSYVHQFIDSTIGTPVFEGVAEGRICSQVLNNLKIVYEPHRSNIRKCRWAIISDILPIDQVESLYKEEYEKRTGKMLLLRGRDKSQPGDGDHGDSFVTSYLNLIGATAEQKSDLDESDFIEVDLLYHLPTPWYPSGMYVVKAGSEILHFGRYPYPFLGRLPLLHFRELISPWRFLGEASVNEVLKNQEQYIRLRRIERDYHLANTCRKILAPKKAKISRDRLTSNENELITYVGERPIVDELRPPGIPNGIYDSLKLTMDERQIGGGINDTTLASMPAAGVTSGKAFLALQEQDDTRLGPMALLAEAEYSIWGQNSLMMGKEFYSEKRKYSIAGNVNAGAVFFFDRAKIGQTTDVVCIPGSALPKNKLAEKEQIRADFVAGIYGDPKSPEAQVKVRKMLSSGMPEDMQDDETVHQQVAEKENVSMISMARQIIVEAESLGAPVTPEALMAARMPIQEFDHDEIHVQGHIRRLNTAGVVDDPQIYAVLADHVRSHLGRIQARSMPLGPTQPGQPGAEPPPPGGQGAPEGSVQTTVASSLPKGGEGSPLSNV